MPQNNYMGDKLIAIYYDRWIHGETLFANFHAKERFYKFVKACVRYVKNLKFVKRQEGWKRLDIDILKAHLYDDLAELREKNYDAYDETVFKIICLFETLLEYEKTSLP